MEKKVHGIDIMDSLHKAADSAKKAADSAKSSIQNVKIPKVKLPEIKIPKRNQEEPVQEEKNEAEPRAEEEEKAAEAVTPMGTVTQRGAIMAFYYLMAVDGEISHSEEEKFDAIGNGMDEKFPEHREQIIKECKAHLEQAEEDDDYRDVLYEGVDAALSLEASEDNIYIPPKLFVWNLLSVAYSDESYSEPERKLILHVVRKLNVTRAIFLEMESSLLTLMDLEKELTWIKTTDRPYLKIESEVNEILKRKEVIFTSVEDLIKL